MKTLPVPRRSHVLLIIFCLLFSVAAAQDSRSYHYTGQIAGSAAQLHLQVDSAEAGAAADRAVGWLMNEAAGTVTQFSGVYRQADSSLFLDLGVDGQLFGFLSSGPADRSRLFKGNLLKGNTALPFRFDQAAQFVTSRMQQDRINTLSSYPYFITARMQAVNDFLQPDLLADQICFFSEGQSQEQQGQLFRTWDYSATTEIAYAAPGLFSGLTTAEYDTGGAHPNLTYWSYNLAYLGTALRPFEVADLFEPEVDVAGLLNPLLQQELTKLEAAWVLDGSSSFELADLQVFTVSPAGLQFVFAPYEVGPWSEGTYRVTLPFADLPGLRADGPLRVISSRSQP